MNLNEWAIKWAVPFEAVEDLRASWNVVNTDPISTVNGKSETAVQNDVRLEASEKGLRLFRNNVGVLYNDRNVPVRYGLCNDSKKLNARLKSSDLIGIRPVLITRDHVGQTIGQFVARETKPESWRYSGNDRETAQLEFLKLIAALGGDVAFATGSGTI